MDPNRLDNDLPAGNDVDLTDAEKAALATRDVKPEDAAAAKAAEEAAAKEAADKAEAEKAAAEKEAADKAAKEAADAAAAKTTEDAGAGAAPQQQGGVFAPDLTPHTERDFKAELAALKAEYGKGDMEDDVYEERREEIIAARTRFETRLELAEESNKQTWATNVNVFLRMPENALLAKSKDHQALWHTMMQAVVDEAAAEKRALSDWDLLAAARDRLFTTIGITAAKEAPKPAAEVKEDKKPPNRAPPLKDLPPDTSRAPAASAPGGKTADELTDMGIQDLESYLATQSDTVRDRLLSSVPGAFVDDK